MARAPASRLNLDKANPGSSPLGLARKLFYDSLSAGHRRCLEFVVLVAREGKFTLSEASAQARGLGISSEPSARRLIQKLRGLGLVSCGDFCDKGIPISMTPLGEMVLIAEGINRERTESRQSADRCVGAKA